MAARILVVDDSATVRRVVRRTLERAGHEVLLATDGREGLEQVQRHVPDLVLLDQHMPHLDGRRFCEALRAIENVREVPVVLMSERPELVGDAAVEATGAVDSITKPFGPEALLAVTAAALGRRAPAAPRAPAKEEPAPPSHEADEARAEAVERIAAALAEPLTDVVRAIALRGGEVSPGRVARAIADGVPNRRILELAAALPRLLPGKGGERSFVGRADHVPLGELLQMLQHQRQTGVLEVTSGERAVAICMRSGRLDFALGRRSDREFLLGRYLLEDEVVERDELESLLRHGGGAPRLLGAQLVKLGYISTEDLRRALVRQTSELVYEALRWPTADYTFERWATRPEADDARLGLPVAAILLEGLRRIDEWRLIEEQIRSFELVPELLQDALGALDEDDFSRDERVVLAAVDGKRTVRELVEVTRMGSFEACRALFGLLTSGLARARTPASLPPKA